MWKLENDLDFSGLVCPFFQRLTKNAAGHDEQKARVSCELLVAPFNFQLMMMMQESCHFVSVRCCL